MLSDDLICLGSQWSKRSAHTKCFETLCCNKPPPNEGTFPNKVLWGGGGGEVMFSRPLSPPDCRRIAANRIFYYKLRARLLLRKRNKSI